MEMEKNLNKKYIKIECTENFSSYKENLLLKNKVQCLLHMDKWYMDNVSYYYYDITHMRSLADRVKQEQVTREFIENLFDDIRKMCNNLESYLLEASELCLHPEFIFEELGSKRHHFIYLMENQEQTKDMEELTECLIAHTDGKEVEWIDTLYEFYNEQLLYGEKMTVIDYLEVWGKIVHKEKEPFVPVEVIQESKVFYGKKDVQNENEIPLTCQSPTRLKRIEMVPFRGRTISLLGKSESLTGTGGDVTL